jgi:hypothetical protein
MDRILRYERGDGGSIPSGGANYAGRQVKGPPAAFQAEDRGVRLSLPAPF